MTNIHREPPEEPELRPPQGFLAGDGNADAAPADPTDESADQVLEDQFDAQLGVLTGAQGKLLRTLSALFASLAGPQDQLEVAGGLNRPQFPMQPSLAGPVGPRSQIQVRRPARGG